MKLCFFFTFYLFLAVQSCSKKRSAVARAAEDCHPSCTGKQIAEYSLQTIWDTLTLQTDWGWVDELVKDQNNRQRKIATILEQEKERKAAGRGHERIIPNTSVAEDRIQRFWILDREEKREEQRKKGIK